MYRHGNGCSSLSSHNNCCTTSDGVGCLPGYTYYFAGHQYGTCTATLPNQCNTVPASQGDYNGLCAPISCFSFWCGDGTCNRPSETQNSCPQDCGIPFNCNAQPGTTWNAADQMCEAQTCGQSGTSGVNCNLLQPPGAGYYCTTPDNMCCQTGYYWDTSKSPAQCSPALSCSPLYPGSGSIISPPPQACCNVGTQFGTPNWQSYTPITIY